MGVGDKLFDAESKSAKIPNSLYKVGGGEGGGGLGVEPVDAESKSVKIPNSLYKGVRGQGRGGGGRKQQLLATDTL